VWQVFYRNETGSEAWRSTFIFKAQHGQIIKLLGLLHKGIHCLSHDDQTQMVRINEKEIIKSPPTSLAGVMEA
jgi:hypothetical protein